MADDLTPLTTQSTKDRLSQHVGVPVLSFTTADIFKTAILITNKKASYLKCCVTWSGCKDARILPEFRAISVCSSTDGPGTELGRRQTKNNSFSTARN